VAFHQEASPVFGDDFSCSAQLAAFSLRFEIRAESPVQHPNLAKKSLFPQINRPKERHVRRNCNKSIAYITSLFFGRTGAATPSQVGKSSEVLGRREPLRL
jgi:hypothetical protein